jgi:hypothetical protein
MGAQQYPMTPQLNALSEALTAAHASILLDFVHIYFVVGNNRLMRHGF